MKKVCKDILKKYNAKTIDEAQDNINSIESKLNEEVKKKIAAMQKEYDYLLAEDNLKYREEQLKKETKK